MSSENAEVAINFIETGFNKNYVTLRQSSQNLQGRSKSGNQLGPHSMTLFVQENKLVDHITNLSKPFFCYTITCKAGLIFVIKLLI